MEGIVNTHDYKQLHEEYMQNLNGTTYTETFIIVSPTFLTVFLSTLLSLFNIKSYQTSLSVRSCRFVIDFLIIVFPAILCFTVLSHAVPLVLLLLLCFISSSAVIYCINIWQDVHFQTYFTDLLNSPMPVKKPFITNFRSITNILTVICILAVDFKVFPRRFAKTETFGYALMDTGVGLFCFSNSLVSREALQHNNRYVPLLQSCINSLKNSLPLIVLGSIRFITTKQADYQVHVSEYGVHWNFFITLAVTKFISTIIVSIVSPKYTFPVSFIVIVIHELILYSGVQEWVLSSIPRNTFLTANREGIASSLGYVALYVAGTGIGHALKSQTVCFKSMLKLDSKLLALSMVCWCSVALSKNYCRISRRLANTGYFLWVLTFTITVLALFLLFDLLMHALKVLSKCVDKNKRSSSEQNPLIYVPIIFESVNYNGLLFFLLANLFTGLVNMSMYTLMVNNFFSVIIIVCYMFVTCGIVFLLYCKNIKLKL